MNYKFLLVMIILTLVIGAGILLYVFKEMVVEFANLEMPQFMKDEIVEDEFEGLIPSEFEGWQTYRNEEYGFEVKYPLEINADSKGLNFVQEAIDKGEQASGTVQPSYDTIVFFDNYKELGFIQIFYKYDGDIIEENYKDKGILYVYGPCDIRWGFNPDSIIMSSINNISALLVSGKDQIKPEENKEIITKNCYYLKNSSGNLIVISDTGHKSDIFDQMLSTFRFIEENSYSFKVIRGGDLMKQKYPDFSIEIYKNERLVKTIDLGEHYDVSDLVLSPDHKYAAFKISGAGGTCVLMESLRLIDLSDYSVIQLDKSDIDRKLSNAIGQDVNGLIKFDRVSEIINDFKWVSNEKIEVDMQFGEEESTCCVYWYNKPNDVPCEIRTKVDFIVK